jgi:hypothetical protein
VSGHDPDRVSVLRTLVGKAAGELRSLRCHDVEAAGALGAARLTAHTLECWWLPALDELAEHGRMSPGTET